MNLPVDIQKSSYFLKEQLTKRLDPVYEVNYTKLWGLDASLNFHTNKPDLPLGLEFLDAWVKDNLGQIPAIYDANSDDIPIVDVEIGKKTYRAAMFALANEWNIIQIEKQRIAAASNTLIPSLDIITAKQEAVGDFFNRGEHYTTLWGYPKLSIFGIFSQPNVSTYDSAFLPYKKTAGAYDVSTAQLYEDLVDIIWNFVIKAKLTSPSQVRLKIPMRLARRFVEIYKTTAGESTGITIQQMLKSIELGLGVASIDIHAELAGLELNKYVPNSTNTGFFPTTRDRIVLKSTGQVAERHSFTRRQYEPYRRSTFMYEQVTLGSTTGVIMVDNTGYAYFDFDNTLA